MESISQKNAENIKILENWIRKMSVSFAAVLLVALASYFTGHGAMAKYLFIAAIVIIVAVIFLIMVVAINAANEELKREHRADE